MGDDDGTERDGSITPVFEGCMFAGFHGGSKFKAMTHATHPEYTAENDRACIMSQITE